MKYLIPAMAILSFCFCLSALILKVGYNIDIVNAKSTPTNNYHHPQIKSETEIYQVRMSDSVSDVCFDGRITTIVVIEGAMILQQCELDSNRWHFNIKIK